MNFREGAVDQSARTSQYSAADATDTSLQACPLPGFASVRAGLFSSQDHISPSLVLGRISHELHAGPCERRDARDREALLEDLRAKVRAIERPVERFESSGEDLARSTAWTLGLDGPDWGRLGLEGVLGRKSVLGVKRVLGLESVRLDCMGVHEIKPSLRLDGGAAAARATALGFALRLVVRRIAGLEALARSGLNAGFHSGRPLIVWCWSRALAREIGTLYGSGLSSLGLDPSSVLLVETARASDTLWSMEEALRSGVPTLVAGVVQHPVDLTAARRLSLAAEAGGKPALLLTQGDSPGTAAVASRWRIGLTPSSRHPLNPRGPGAFAAWVKLVRCPGAAMSTQSSPSLLEWCDETHRFRLPAALAHRTDGDLLASSRATSQRGASL